MRAFLRSVAVLAIAGVSLAPEADAQGKGRAKGDNDDRGGKLGQAVQQGHPHGKGRRAWTSDEAVDVARLVLREDGYELVRVERRAGARVVYYRRGNMGRGKGKGPVMYMIVRPSSERIIIERAPRTVIARINVRLGY
jgi:hypothetical protein